MTAVSLGTPAPPGFGERIWRINWGLILVLSAQVRDGGIHTVEVFVECEPIHLL